MSRLRFWVMKRIIKNEIDHLIEGAYIKAQIALAKEANGVEAVNEKVAVGQMNVLQELRHALLGRVWKPNSNLMTMRKLALGDLKDGREEKDKA